MNIVCCLTLNVNLENDVKDKRGNFEGVYTFQGFSYGRDYWIDAEGENAIWYYVSGSNHAWVMGSQLDFGTTSGFIYSSNNVLKKKCPNNEGYVLSWKYWDGSSWIATNDVSIKCANEDDFCTSENPCGPDEGDCDSHDECQFGLTCGSNNCPESLNTDMDCCYINCLDNWIGDMFCDDANNYKECNWDGGDCCGEYVINGHCEYCECRDPTDE